MGKSPYICTYATAAELTAVLFISGLGLSLDGQQGRTLTVHLYTAGCVKYDWYTRYQVCQTSAVCLRLLNVPSMPAWFGVPYISGVPQTSECAKYTCLVCCTLHQQWPPRLVVCQVCLVWTGVPDTSGGPQTAGGGGGVYQECLECPVCQATAVLPDCWMCLLCPTRPTRTRHPMGVRCTRSDRGEIPVPEMTNVPFCALGVTVCPRLLLLCLCLRELFGKCQFGLATWKIRLRRYSATVREQSSWTVQMYSNVYGRVRGVGAREKRDLGRKLRENIDISVEVVCCVHSRPASTVLYCDQTLMSSPRVRFSPGDDWFQSWVQFSPSHPYPRAAQEQELPLNEVGPSPGWQPGWILYY